MIRDDGTSTIVELIGDKGRKYGVHDEASGYKATIWTDDDKVRIANADGTIVDLTPEQVCILGDLLTRMREVLALPVMA